MSEATNTHRRARLLLAVGAAAGLVLAAFDLLRAPHAAEPLPAGAVATVNGVAVPAAEYERALSALAADRRTPLDEDDRRHVLDRLIDEELLVQKGLDLELPRRDRRVRSDIVASVVESVVAEAAADVPGDDEARAFYADNRALFTRPGRVRVRQVLVRVTPERPDAPARDRASQAAERLRAGEEFATVAGELGDRPIVPLPVGKLDAEKLREYLGPTVTRTIAQLPVGAPSDPVRSAAGYHVIEVLERDPDVTPPFEEIADLVRGELRRRRQDDALRRYLGELRDASAVQIREPAP
ncbi:MAG: peptidylprolyl isomerase [Thermodesulfobacteriota bacterium]